LKQGLHINLYQLTSGAKIIGYCTIPIFIKSNSGRDLCFKYEAYVVCNMRTALLLGEDFHVTFGLDTLRSSPGRPQVQVGNTGEFFTASSSKVDKLNFEIRRAETTSPFIRKKQVYRERKKRLRKKQLAPFAAYATEPITIPASSVANIPITLPPESPNPNAPAAEWIVEPVAVVRDDGSVLAAPFTFLNREKPFLPILNTSEKPLCIEVDDLNLPESLDIRLNPTRLPQRL
jgi:hypothetical protein